MDLFEYNAKVTMAGDAPLADRMRPRTLDDFIGQSEAVGEGSLIRQAIATQRLFSMILWGPPGCGKTTLARLIAGASQARFVEFSAVLSGVKDIRQVIQEARQQRDHHHRRTLLFVDEIHRFNKAQQDAFLHHVETGLITLIGATTENPSFEVIPALLSRCRVVVLTPHQPETLAKIVDAALADTEKGLGKWNCRIAPEAMEFLVRIADGDARTVLNNLEMAVALRTSQDERLTEAAPVCIQLADVETVLQKKALRYDKSGDEHFNLISALHKSLRGSDPDAALYWLARMLDGGCDPAYVARRVVRMASEDIGNADPRGLALALDAWEAWNRLGSPEGELALAQAVAYLASAPKSNAVYRAWDDLGGPTADGPNDLEPAALVVEPRLARWRDLIEARTGRAPVLAGSGATWFTEGEHGNALADLTLGGSVPGRPASAPPTWTTDFSTARSSQRSSQVA